MGGRDPTGGPEVRLAYAYSSSRATIGAGKARVGCDQSKTVRVAITSSLI